MGASSGDSFRSQVLLSAFAVAAFVVAALGGSGPAYASHLRGGDAGDKDAVHHGDNPGDDVVRTYDIT